jgi:hypothetical protein
VAISQKFTKDETAAAGDQLHGLGLLGPPDEPAADRAAHLEAVPRLEALDEVRRHLAVLQPLDGQFDVLAVGGRADRVGAAGLVAVGGREPDVEVLPGEVTGPAGHAQRDQSGGRSERGDRLGGRLLPDHR